MPAIYHCHRLVYFWARLLVLVCTLDKRKRNSERAGLNSLIAMQLAPRTRPNYWRRRHQGWSKRTTTTKITQWEKELFYSVIVPPGINRSKYACLNQLMALKTGEQIWASFTNTDPYQELRPLLCPLQNKGMETTEYLDSFLLLHCIFIWWLLKKNAWVIKHSKSQGIGHVQRD